MTWPEAFVHVVQIIGEVTIMGMLIGISFAVYAIKKLNS